MRCEKDEMSLKIFGNGRLTGTPEVRYTAQGAEKSAWARFSIASERAFHKEGEQDADFIECKVFNTKLAEFVEKYLDKGRKITVFGTFRNDDYLDKNGNKVKKDTIIVDTIEFADSKPAGNEQGTQTVQQNTTQVQQNTQQNKQNVQVQAQTQNNVQAQPAPQQMAAKNRATKSAQAQVQTQAQPQTQPAPQQSQTPVVQQNGNNAFLDFSQFGDLPLLN